MKVNDQLCFNVDSRLMCLLGYSHSLSLIAIRCHPMSLIVTFYHSLYHSLSLVNIRCHSLSFVVTRCQSLPFLVTRFTISCHSTRCTTPCHSLSFVVTRCTTRCHSLSLVVTRCTTHLSFYKRYYISMNFYIKFSKVLPLSIVKRILRNYVPFVPACLTYLRALRAYAPYVPTCLHASNY